VGGNRFAGGRIAIITIECEKPNLENVIVTSQRLRMGARLALTFALASNQIPWRKFADSLCSTRMQDGLLLGWSIECAGLFSEQMQMGPSAKNRERMLS
jgi:hypothetical protein